MKTHSPQNERIERAYLSYLAEAKGFSEAIDIRIVANSEAARNDHEIDHVPKVLTGDTGGPDEGH
jgi:hypothetical protein